MKKKIIIFISILILIISVIVFWFINKNQKPFFLENDYYGGSKITEIEFNELNELVENKKSFVIFIYQPMCVTSANFESVLNEFLKENQISIYKISFANIKDTYLNKYIKYYPSFIIYNKGKIVDFLEADKDEDVSSYTSKDEFKNWFTKYVKLKDINYKESDFILNEPKKEENNYQEDVNFQNIVKEDNKINIYFFWGKGCPHCEEEFAFFNSLDEEDKNRYNLYTFEIWYNEENAKLVHIFAQEMNDTVTGVPYTIIGNKSFKGFGKNSKEEFINAINKQYKNSYDIYFDKIKK